MQKKSYMLNAISPIDGRYYNKTEKLKKYFSEEALIKYRIQVEVEYFLALCNSSIVQLNHFPIQKQKDLKSLYINFNTNDAKRVKEIEKKTNHDVKAVEYYLKEKFDALNLSEFKEFIHFGLTSQDINNTALPISIKEALNDVYYPFINEILKLLKAKAKSWKNISMLARTHGQAASPTRMGKEITVFIERIEQQLVLLKKLPLNAKFGGATGNFNAHHVTFPNINWVEFADNFIKNTFKLKRQKTTTQIEHYDNLSALIQNISRINTILIDFAKDIWTYIALDYFKQKIKDGEIGSSAMPHKVNPIDFENAEGNFGISNSMNEFFVNKLTKSRLQRDLSDSTVLRNIGLSFGYSQLAVSSISKGLDKVKPNKEVILNELNNNWEVLTEAVQTIMRYEGIDNAYEQLKSLSRGNKLNKESYLKFVSDLPISDKSKEKLLKLTPSKYIGLANKL